MPARSALPPRPTAARRALGLALTVIGVAALIGAAIQLVLLFSIEGMPWVAGLFPAMTCVYVGAGCFAWWRRPDNRIGLLLIAGGGAAWIAGLTNVSEPVLVAAGEIATTLPIAVVMHLLIAFPSGRLHGTLERATALAGYAVCLILQIPAYAFEADGPLTIAARPDLVDTGLWVQRVVGAAVVAVICAIVLRRLRAAPPAQRRVLAPLALYGLVAILAIPLGSALADFVFDARTLLLPAVQLSIVGCVPLVFVAAASRGGFARTADVEELGSWLSDDDRRPGIADALRTALGDPSVELRFRVPGGWVTATGVAVEEPVADDVRGVAEVARGDETIGAIVYDAILLGGSDDVRTAARVVALALDRERLTVELRASRARLVEASDAERRRIAADLHDGLQSRLVLLAVRAGLADMGELRDGIETAIDELRALVHGLMPAELTERGLPAAVEGLADRMPVPVALRVDGIDGRLPPAVESTGFFVVSEALVNAVKHARASRLEVSLSRNGRDALRIAIGDDGVGGADVVGHGLRSMADRVEALGGTLMISSPVGTGTRVEAELPCAS